MSEHMENLYKLMLMADAAHKAGRIAEFDLLMAEVYDTFDDLPREEREWLISQTQC